MPGARCEEESVAVSVAKVGQIVLRVRDLADERSTENLAAGPRSPEVGLR